MQDLVQRLVKEAVGSKEQPTPWPAALIVGLFAVLLLGIQFFAMVLAGRKHAASAHKLDVLKNDLRQKEVLFDQLEENQAKREKIAENIAKLETKKKSVENDLRAVEEQRSEFRKKLEAVTDWDDVL